MKQAKLSMDGSVQTITLSSEEEIKVRKRWQQADVKRGIREQEERKKRDYKKRIEELPIIVSELIDTLEANNIPVPEKAKKYRDNVSPNTSVNR